MLIKETMNTDLVKRDSTKDLNFLPGYFTGNYTAKASSSSIPQIQKLTNAAQSFTNELQRAMQENPIVLKNTMMQPAKVQNVLNGLPLTASVTERIGAEGAILALSAALRYCQYYKKNSPSPRFM